MTAQEIVALIEKQVPDVHLITEGFEPTLSVPVQALFSVMEILKTAPDLAFNTLMNQTALHDGDELKIYWHLFSYSQNHRFVVEVTVPIDDPKVSSVTSLWKAADWLERETFDLFGIHFIDHPDLRRIMLPDDWEGHPLRKDYVDSKIYRDIDNTPSEIDQSFNPKDKNR